MVTVVSTWVLGNVDGVIHRCRESEMSGLPSYVFFLLGYSPLSYRFSIFSLMPVAFHSTFQTAMLFSNEVVACSSICEAPSSLRSLPIEGASQIEQHAVTSLENNMIV